MVDDQNKTQPFNSWFIISFLELLLFFDFLVDFPFNLRNVLDAIEYFLRALLYSRKNNLKRAGVGQATQQCPHEAKIIRNGV